MLNMSDFPDTTLVSNGEKESPFYTSEDPVAGTKEGWIVNQDDAHEVANLEAVARNAEERLLNEHETGLTEKEKRNLEIVDVLVEEFPSAFKECTDKLTGEKYYQTGISSQPYSKRNEEEAVRLNEEFDKLLSEISDRPGPDFQLQGLLDMNNKEYVCISKVGIQFEGRKKPYSISFENLIPERQELFLKILKFLNDRGEVINKHLEEEKAKVTPEGLRERIRIMKSQ